MAILSCHALRMAFGGPPVLDGATLHVAPDYDKDVEQDIADWFEKFYTIQFRNYPVSDDYISRPEVIDCGH